MLYGADLGRAMPHTRGADTLPPIELLRRMFVYNERTGWLVNRYTRSHNARAGERAGSANARTKKRYVSIAGYGKIQESRIIWAMRYGAWPEKVLDHKDRNGGNNKISNLRDTTQSINSRNRSLRSDNTTGHRGVYRYGSKWLAKIDRKHLGVYATVEQAVAARKKAENLLWDEQ